jgi:hypothetical protein
MGLVICISLQEETKAPNGRYCNIKWLSSDAPGSSRVLSVNCPTAPSASRVMSNSPATSLKESAYFPACSPVHVDLLDVM